MTITSPLNSITGVRQQQTADLNSHSSRQQGAHNKFVTATGNAQQALLQHNPKMRYQGSSSSIHQLIHDLTVEFGCQTSADQQPHDDTSPAEPQHDADHLRFTSGMTLEPSTFSRTTHSMHSACTWVTNWQCARRCSCWSTLQCMRLVCQHREDQWLGEKLICSSTGTRLLLPRVILKSQITQLSCAHVHCPACLLQIPQLHALSYQAGHRHYAIS